MKISNDIGFELSITRGTGTPYTFGGDTFVALSDTDTFSLKYKGAELLIGPVWNIIINGNIKEIAYAFAYIMSDNISVKYDETYTFDNEPAEKTPNIYSSGVAILDSVFEFSENSITNLKIDYHTTSDEIINKFIKEFNKIIPTIRLLK